MKRLFILLAIVVVATPVWAQQPAAADEPKPRLDIYGFAMLDFGYNFTSINPNWFDTMRVTRLPKFDEEFGKDGSVFAGVRQSRLGVKGFTPTKLGELQTTFEFELFGTGVDEGQTTFRLRHAYGELGRFGAGQTWSPFSDTDVFPNSVEYLWTNRDCLVPQRPASLHGDEKGEQQPGDRPRTPGCERRPGHLRRPHRAGRHSRPIPCSRHLGGLQDRG